MGGFQIYESLVGTKLNFIDITEFSDHVNNGKVPSIISLNWVTSQTQFENVERFTNVGVVKAFNRLSLHVNGKHPDRIFLQNKINNLLTTGATLSLCFASAETIFKRIFHLHELAKEMSINLRATPSDITEYNRKCKLLDFEDAKVFCTINDYTRNNLDNEIINKLLCTMETKHGYETTSVRCLIPDRIEKIDCRINKEILVHQSKFGGYTAILFDKKNVAVKVFQPKLKAGDAVNQFELIQAKEILKCRLNINQSNAKAI